MRSVVELSIVTSGALKHAVDMPWSSAFVICTCTQFTIAVCWTDMQPVMFVVLMITANWTTGVV